MTATTTTRDDALRAAVAALPELPWLAADFVGADCKIGRDYAGDPAVWVRMIARDGATARAGFHDEFIDTRNRIRDHLRGYGVTPDEFVYFNLWTEDDVRNPPGDYE